MVTAAAATTGVVVSVEIASKGVEPGLVMVGIGLSGGCSGWRVSGSLSSDVVFWE